MKEYIKVVRQRIKGIPVLFCYSNHGDNKIPIIVLHKLMNDKESELQLGVFLAEQGFFAIIPDMPFHGEFEDSIRQKGRINFNNLFSKLDVTIGNIKIIIDEVSHMDVPISIKDFMVVGTSYGGMVALAAGYLFDEITAVASLCASASWSELIENGSFEAFRLYSETRPVVVWEEVRKDVEQFDPYYHTQLYKGKPILLMNGALDTTFRISMVEPFYDKLYTQYQEKVTWLKYPRIGHQVRYEMMVDLVSWIKNAKRR